MIVVEKSNTTAAAVAGKDPASFEKRDNVNEFEHKPMIDKKYQPVVKKVMLSKHKTTKEMMEKRLQKKREKRAEKKLLLEAQLKENTEKTKHLKNIGKKHKMSS